jgi:hypothetical protein
MSSEDILSDSLWDEKTIAVEMSESGWKQMIGEHCFRPPAAPFDVTMISLHRPSLAGMSEFSTLPITTGFCPVFKYNNKASLAMVLILQNITLLKHFSP